MKFLKLIVLSGFIVALSFSCAHRNDGRTGTETGAGSETTDSMVQLNGDYVISSIDFMPSSRELSSEARAEIERAVRLAEKNGYIDAITVAVWSDEEYPGPERKLSREQIRLARDRGDRIEDFIEDNLDMGPVAVHNMAKNPNALARMLRTEDARLKAQLVARGIAPTSYDEPVSNGKASTALILIRTSDVP